MLTRVQKEEQAVELKSMFSRATCVYVADYCGLNVEAVNALRRRVRAEGKGDYEYRVTKNSVLRRAAEGSDVAGIAELFQGPTAVALSYSDPAGLAKILQEFAKDHEAFEVKGGVLDGAPVGRDEMRSMIVGLIQAPATKLARLLNEPAAQLARLFEARAKQGEAGG